MVAVGMAGLSGGAGWVPVQPMACRRPAISSGHGAGGAAGKEACLLMWQAGDMNYSIEFLGTAGADDAPASGGQATGSSASLAGAVEQAERMVAQSGQGEAVISREPDKASGGRAGAEIARYSADGGWRSEAITPASWWARLSLPTKEKLK